HVYQTIVYARSLHSAANLRSTQWGGGAPAAARRRGRLRPTENDAIYGSGLMHRPIAARRCSTRSSTTISASSLAARFIGASASPPAPRTARCGTVFDVADLV